MDRLRSHLPTWTETGDLDLAFANYGQNSLYLNSGTGVYADATSQLPQAISSSSDLAFADLDGDGDQDLLFGNDFFEPNHLYLNDGAGNFSDATANLPVAANKTLALAVSDVDLDGDVDFVTGNGLQNRLYLNNGVGVFTDATSAGIPPVERQTRAIVLADLDDDDDPDLFAGNVDTPPELYVALYRQVDTPNIATPGGNWDIEFHARYGGALPPTALAFLSSASTVLPLPLFGTLRLDPTAAAALTAVVLSQPGGPKTYSMTIPPLPGLVGTELYVQAL